MMKKTLTFILFALLAFAQTAWAQNIVSVDYVDENGTPQNVNATSLDHIASVNPNGANIGSTGFTNWYVVQGNDVVLNGQLGYNGGINLILCDGAKLTINNTDGNAITCLDNTETTTTLTIYVQANGTGQLVATSTNGEGIRTENLTIHGGVISATGGNCGIYAPQNNIVINGGTVTAVAQNGNAIEGYNVTINGGIVSATGNGGIQNGMTGTTTLGYTKNTDRIFATNYLLGYTAASVKVKDGLFMITENGVIVYGYLNENKRNAIAGHTLSPYTPTEWSGSGESADDPYIIASVDDLNLLSLRTNGGGNNYSGKFFKLNANITYTHSTDWDEATSTENNFIAIAGFNGHFDGNGHTISGLRIYANDNYHDQNGLFTNLGPNAYIEDVTLTNARIVGQAQVGGIAGNVQNGATITNCHVTNTVAVHALGHTLQNHGGLVGENHGTISNCVSEATISRGYYTNDDGKSGGIAGANYGTLSGNKVFNANITAAQHYGAITGSNDGGTLTYNYYRATVNGTANATAVGCDGADVSTDDGALSLHTITKPSTVNIVTSATITYNNINYWAQGKTITLSGGLDDTPTDGWQKAYFVNGEANTSDAFTPSDTFTITPAEDITITLGEIHADWATAQTGTSDNPYKIYFTDQLDLLASRVNEGETYRNKYFKLMNDLTYSYEGLGATESNYTAIGKYLNANTVYEFSGHFDGDGHTISGIRIYKSGTTRADRLQGLFGFINYDAEVKNLTLTDANIAGYYYTGGIVGWIAGSNASVTNCHVTASVTIRTLVDETYYHGGIVGYNEGIISDCTSAATLTIEAENYTNCKNYGAITGRNNKNLTNNLVFGATIPEATDQFGAIAGESGSTGSVFIANYYRGCTVGNTANATGVGCDNADIDGALPLFTLSVADGITATAEVTLTRDEVNYYMLNTPVLLANDTPAPQGEQLIYSVNGNPIVGDSFNMSADAIVTVASATVDWETQYQGTEEDPYLIYYKEQWDLLAERVNGTNDNPKNYSGKFFKLMEDISITEMVGGGDGSSNIFSGTFDGNGHTITFNAENATEQYIAPFRRIDGATIMGVKLEGTVSSINRFAGGIVAYAKGTSTVTNCINSTNISTVNYNLTDSPSNGGIVGMVGGNGTINISGCVFNGQMHGTQNNNWCGILGLCNGGCTSNISNCFFAPEAVTLGSGNHTIYRNNGVATTPTNCYYTQAMGTNQGDKVYTITPAEPVTVQLLGDAEVYDVSGITIYGTGDKGLKFDDVFYAASGNVLDLNLGVTVPFTVANYLANGEVITFNTTLNNYTLTMSEEDVTITATFSDVAWDGEGTEESPYLIYYNVQWDLLGTNVNAGNNYNGVYFKLMDDISIETMVGSTNRPFRGIFDGGGHTLTFNKGTEASPYDQNFCAPFKAVEAATIKNLHTTGAIYTSAQHAAGFVAQLIPNSGHFTRFISCRSSMKINSTVASDARSGGFIGSCSDALPSFTNVSDRLSIFFEDCLFDGEFNGTATGWGGFVGYYFHCESEGGNSGMVDFTRCLFAPSAMNISSTDAYNFVRSDLYGWDEVSGEWHHSNSYPEDVMTITKLYYTITCGNLENYLDEVQPTPVGNMTNVQLRNALGDNWMIVTEDNVEKVVPTMGNIVPKTIAGYGDSDGGYVLIASPVGTVNPAHVAHMLSNEYDLYAFDQNPSDGKEWRNYEADAFNLEPGKGYLYANSEDVTLIFPGTPYTGNGEVTLSKTTGVDFEGFNLVGNPYNETAYIADGRDFYTMNGEGSEIVASTSNSIEAMEGIFVIASSDGEAMTFTTTEPATNGGAKLALNLTQGRGVIDRAIIRFGEGRQLPKFQLRDNSTKLYIPQDGTDYAVVNAEQEGEMPINFKAKENGVYTLTISETFRSPFSVLRLIDHLTGADIDLLQTPSYTFEARTTDYASRFKLVFNVKEDNNNNQDNFAFISNGEIIVNGEGMLQMFDVTGRTVYTAKVNSAFRIPHSAFTSGVYVLQLTNGYNVKTQKIVIE